MRSSDVTEQSAVVCPGGAAMLVLIKPSSAPRTVIVLAELSETIPTESAYAKVAPMSAMLTYSRSIKVGGTRKRIFFPVIATRPRDARSGSSTHRLSGVTLMQGPVMFNTKN
jgi:hypothetical protein